MGRAYRWLLAATWIGNLGDGLALAAGPLLVASLTDQSLLVASAALLQWLPPLLFGLLAGVVTDRLDRRRTAVVGNLLRVAVLTVLTTGVATGSATVGVVLVCLFLLGTAEVFTDNTEATLVPMLVHRDDLAVANARVQAAFVTLNQLVGPPIGAFLFAAGHAIPFGSQAALGLLAVALLSRMRLPAASADRAGQVGRSAWHDVVEGLRFTLRQPAVRTLVLTIAVFNVTFGAAWSVLVLYATQRLGLGSVGYGLIATVGAAGGLVGTLGYGWLTRRVSLGDLMRIGLVVETLTHLALALATSPYVALPVFFVFGAHAFVWGTTSLTVRQRAVPTALQGRVNAVNTLGVFGGLVVGAGIGGLLAQHLGVVAPFWFAFAGSALLVAVLWRQLALIAHADEERVGGSAVSPG